MVGGHRPCGLKPRYLVSLQRGAFLDLTVESFEHLFPLDTEQCEDPLANGRANCHQSPLSEKNMNHLRGKICSVRLIFRN